MKRYVLHTPFNIYHFEADKWQHPVHNHTYFEIIFVLRGDGTHHINGNAYSYSAGDVYLLGPEDFHYFDVNGTTEFCFIRFNESFSKSQAADTDRHWQQVLETLLRTSSQSRGSIVTNEREKQKLRQLLAVLEEEYEQHQSSYFEAVRDSLMRSMMIILARNLTLREQTATIPASGATVEPILMYIKQNIYQPARLSMARLAEEFNMAPAYIGIFFKRHTGESLKQYITRHRIKLIEARLLYSSLNLGEIAHEFGYTDESHLCRQFRKYTGSTPTAFRRAMGEVGTR